MQLVDGALSTTDAVPVDEDYRVLSHELRAPLSALNIGVEMLLAQLGELSPEEVRPFLLRMQRSVWWLETLIDNVTTHAQLGAGVLSVRRTPIDVIDFVEVAQTIVQPLLQRARQQLRVVGLVPGLRVYGDPRRIEQILVNLLTNASKHGRVGDVIEINFSQSGEWLRISVADHGPGIPPDEQGEIFAPFVRGRLAREQMIRGVGLGLHIVRSLVELHGGRMGVKSVLGQGTSFWFTLPMQTEMVDADETALPGSDGRLCRDSAQYAPFLQPA